MKELGGIVSKELRTVISGMPYEPCLYIYKNDAVIKILHNAFDVYDLVEKFNSGETVLGPDGRSFDLDSFCRVLAAALSDKRYEMNWTFAASRVN